MKHLTTTIAVAALLAFSIPAGAQVYPAPQMPYYSAYWPEMVDNGCCTDFPTHTPSDFVADQLNQQVVNFNNASPIYSYPYPYPYPYPAYGYASPYGGSYPYSGGGYAQPYPYSYGY